MNENYEDYEENLDNTEYEYEDDDSDKSSRNKKILLVALVIVTILIIFLLLRACGKKEEKFDYEKTLLEAGKEYYEYNGNEIPKAESSCTTVSLSKLISEGLINPDNYADCNGENTYVKVCLLENKKVHYVPILSCENFDSDEEYEDYALGDISDIIEDETDIKYAYMGQMLKKDVESELGSITELWYGDKIPYENYKLLGKTTYYRYRDLQFRWYEKAKIYYPNNTISGGRELYIVSPAAGYTNKSNAQTASKWYKIVSAGEKVYYSKYSRVVPDGYPHRDDENPQIIRSRSRTFTSNGNTPTMFTAPKMYKCAESKYKSQLELGNETGVVFTMEVYPCGDSKNVHPEHDYEYSSYYTCDKGSTRVMSGTMCYTCPTGEINGAKNQCGTYSDWTYNTTTCTVESDVCENYAVPVYYYKWYKWSEEKRSYYPSNSSTAAGEKTYYAIAPEVGYAKDDTTTTTAWNWYKEDVTLTAGYLTTAPSVGATKSPDSKWTDWSEWSTTVVQGLGSAGTRSIDTKVKMKIQELKNTKSTDYENVLEEYTEDVQKLIEAFKAKGYEVDSLEDIAMNGELKYLVKMYIRNKK